MYGESTPAGLEWQFRDIKKLAKAQQEAVNNGNSPADVLNGAGGASTPSSRSINATPGSRAGTPTPTPGGKRAAAAGVKRKQGARAAKTTGVMSYTVDDDDEYEDDTDYEGSNSHEADDTPSNRKRRQKQAKFPPSAGTGGVAAGAKKSNADVISLDDDDIDIDLLGVGAGGSAKSAPVKKEPAAPAGMNSSSMVDLAYTGPSGHFEDAFAGGDDGDLPEGEV